VVGFVEVGADSDGRGSAWVGAEEGGAEAGGVERGWEGEGGRGVGFGAVEDAVGVGELGGEEGDGGGGGERDLAEVVVEDEGLGREAVDVRGGVSGVAVAPEVVGAGGVDDDDDEVGAGDGAPEESNRFAVLGESRGAVSAAAPLDDAKRLGAERQGEERQDAERREEQVPPQPAGRPRHQGLSAPGTGRAPKAAMASFMRSGISMPAGQRVTHSPQPAQASAGMPRES